MDEHPGLYILKNYLYPGKVSLDQLKEGLLFTDTKLNEFLKGNVDVDQSIAQRLSLLFEGTTPEYWLSSSK